jgi:hypothetical protein
MFWGAEGSAWLTRVTKYYEQGQLRLFVYEDLTLTKANDKTLFGRDPVLFCKYEGAKLVEEKWKVGGRCPQSPASVVEWLD